MEADAFMKEVMGTRRVCVYGGDVCASDHVYRRKFLWDIAIIHTNDNDNDNNTCNGGLCQAWCQDHVSSPVTLPANSQRLPHAHPILQTGKLRLMEVKGWPKDTQLVDGPTKLMRLHWLYHPAFLRFKRIGGTGQCILGSGHSGLLCQCPRRAEGSRLWVQGSNGLSPASPWRPDGPGTQM